MGNGQSNIKVLDIPVKNLQKHHISIQSSAYVEPSRQFMSQYHKKSSGSQHESIVRIKAPQQQVYSLSQPKYQQIQQAYEQKTKNFQIEAIIFDEYYADRFTYLVKDLQIHKTVLIRKFQSHDSHTFGNIICEVSISQQISKLPSKNLLKLNQSYLIENKQIKFQNPKTQVLQYQGVAASLSEIIKYRRQNSWQWIQNEFDQLVYDLASGLSALHQAKISHNDIRPQNIFYCPSKKCYVIGQFSYSTKHTQKGNLRGNRASMSFIAPQANFKQFYDFKKADIYSLGATLMCALYLCNPLNIDQSMKYNGRFRKINGYKAVLQMIRSQSQRRSISEILATLHKPDYQNKQMHNLIQSLRFKIMPRNKNQKIYKLASTQLFKRLGLWEDWRDQIDQILESDHELNTYQTAQLYMQLALIDYCQDELQVSAMKAKRAAKLFRQMGEQAFSQGDLNLALRNYTHAVQCSKFYVDRYDIDLAKSLICLSKVHAQKRQQQLSSTLLNQAKEIIIKQSSSQSILYSQMKIKQAELAKKFFRYQESLQHLEQALNVARKMQLINQRQSKLCQARVLTLMAHDQVLICKGNEGGDGVVMKLQRAEQYLNRSKGIYEGLDQIDCHLELAENTQVLGLVNIQKKQYSQAKTCFQSGLQMRRWYQQNRKQPLYIPQHATTLSNLGRCQRLMNVNQQLQTHKQAEAHQKEALEIFKKVYGSDHNYHTAGVLKEMGNLYDAMGKNCQAKDCYQCSKLILQDLYAENSPYDQI